MKDIILIGMPGVGKSTIGVVLAKKLGLSFLDSDLLIQEQEGRLLHEIIQQDGLEEFNRIEEEVNASIQQQNAVIATGGSAVYGQRAMEHLKKIGTIVYLKLPYEELVNRLGDLEERGVAMKKNQTLNQLMEERTPLYEKYSDVIIDCHEKQIREIVEEISQGINREKDI